LNRRFRGKDRATDVLSFSAAADDARKRFAGELAISAEMAAENARAFGHPAAVEIKVLVLHGVLHLAGYDHERDGGEMARCEEELRARLGLPPGLIGRTAHARSVNSGGAGRRETLRGRAARKTRS
jgi:probable rRNA maturation factor